MLKMKHMFYFSRLLKLGFNLIYSRVLRCFLLRKLRNKLKVDVIFIVKLTSQWKYDSIYNRFHSDNRFNTSVFVLPDMDIPNWEEQFNKSYMYFKNKSYNVVNLFDLKTNNYINRINSCDLVFFSRLPSANDPSFVKRLLSRFSCYVPYSIFSDTNYNAQYGAVNHKLLWKYYVPSGSHKNMAYSSSRLVNTVAVGYPNYDFYYSGGAVKSDRWKKQKYPKKKLIWSPHWTIFFDDEKQYFSNFILMAEFMIIIANKYSDSMQFAFKPHPNLKKQLYDSYDWGRKKTDEYFAEWDKLDNGQLEEYEYEDLFMSSDALINDSVSFLAEYLYSNKPQCYIISNGDIIENHFNDFGKKIVSALYVAVTEEEVERFITDVVLEENDVLYEKRINIFNATLNSNSFSATDLIYDNICSEFFNH